MLRKLSLLELLVLLSLTLPVRCYAMHYKQSNAKWTSSGMDSQHTNQWPRVVLYPKCLEDSHCAGEQICHFQSFETYRQTDQPLVSYGSFNTFKTIHLPCLTNHTSNIVKRMMSTLHLFVKALCAFQNKIPLFICNCDTCL